MEAQTTDQTFIGRQPIVNAKQNIIGYEFFFRHSANANSAVFEQDIKSCASVLLATIDQMEEAWRLGDKYAFINVNSTMLESEFLELMPANKTVLEVVHNIEVTPALIERCEALKKLGFKIALDNPNQYAHLQALLPHTDFVKIDMRQINVGQAILLHKTYHRNNLNIIAERVETREQFDELNSIGYAYFQGYFYAKPETMVAKVINPSFESVLNILNMVSQDADNKMIEEGFKRDATLSYKLLRYINSVGFGLSCEVQSLNHAFSIIGRNQLYRWLTLLMVTAGNNSTSSALMKTSITRGRLTELLGESYFDKAGRDNLFIVGVFSLLDVILKMPMDKVLDKLKLPEPVTEAITNREGIYGPFLKLTEACEDANNDQIIQLAASLQLEADKVNQSHIEALAWTEALGI